MNTDDIIEARRQREAAILRAAYDYALATQGCSRDGMVVILHCKTEHEAMVSRALSQLTHEAKMLAPSLLVDACVCPTREIDRRLAQAQAATPGAAAESDNATDDGEVAP